MSKPDAGSVDPGAVDPGAALIASGLEHHRRGELDAAWRLYVQATAASPKNPDALHLLGVLAQQRGDFAGSVELIERAIRLTPAAHYHANLANAFNQLGRSEQARAQAQAAVRLDPRSAGALCNLGIAQRALKAFDEAERSFQAAIALNPAYADAWSNLGVVLTELGRFEAAEAALQRAVALSPGVADAWLNLGNALLRLSRWDDAANAYERALTLRPDFVEAHANRGAALKALGRPDEALEAFETAARLSPGSAVALHNLGQMLGELKHFEDALVCLDRAIALDEPNPSSHIDRGNVLYELARTRQDASALALYDRAIEAHRRAIALSPDLVAAHYNLGLVLLDRGLLKGAADAFRAALARAPDYAEAHCNLGHCLAELGQYEEAVEECERALALRPGLAEAQSTLGNIFIGRGRLEAAEEAYRAALAFKPALAGGYCNLGVALFRQGRGAEALDVYDQALALDPHSADAHWNRALALLQRGDYAQGWAEYEWRLRRARRIREDVKFTQPLWAGEPLDGETILLHTEQGLGDSIQCARFVPRIAELGAQIVLQAPRSLTGLFAAIPGVARVIADAEPAPPVAYRLPLFSLPRLFAPSPDAVPAPVPYLGVDPALAISWTERMRDLGGPGARRIGIVWSGNVTSEAELGRSIPLAAMAPLAGTGVHLVSLQKGHGVDQLQALPPSMAVSTLGPAYDAGDLADTAAVIEALDLVICCDTSVAHLAGALGRPVWMAVNAVADWRWLEGRTDTPWYPTLRIYRQPRPGDWGSVFEAMAENLWVFHPGPTAVGAEQLVERPSGHPSTAFKLSSQQEAKQAQSE